MSRQVAFLRAINVGGRRVSNDRLVELVSEAGFTDVSGYQASGNILFDPGDVGPGQAETRIEEALAEGLGWSSEAFVRTAQQLEAIIDADPFDAELVEQAKTKPQVAFLNSAPEEEAVAGVMDLQTEVDRLAVVGRELHWLPINGVGRAELDLARIEALVGRHTVRSTTTVARILRKL